MRRFGGGLLLGIALSLGFFMYFYFNFYLVSKRQLEERNKELVKCSETLGMQLGEERKTTRELKKMLSDKEKALIKKDEEIRFRDKTILCLKERISQGNASLNIVNSSNGVYEYDIEEEDFCGKITVFSTTTPQGVEYIIKLKGLDFEVAWTVVERKDGSYKIIINSNNPNIIIKNNEFYTHRKEKGFWQHLHGEFLVGAYDSILGEVVFGYKNIRVGGMVGIDLEGNQKYGICGGVGF